MERLRGSVKIEYTLAARGANKLWELMHSEPYVPALGALTGGQAVQSVRAGLKAIYISGWCAHLLGFAAPAQLFTAPLVYGISGRFRFALHWRSVCGSRRKLAPLKGDCWVPGPEQKQSRKTDFDT